jgi:hypothetical protein
MLRKPKVVSDWRDAPKWLSMRFGAAALLIQSTWLALPSQFIESYPPEIAKYVGMAVGVLTLLALAGRLISQEIDTGPETQFDENGEPKL